MPTDSRNLPRVLIVESGHASGEFLADTLRTHAAAAEVRFSHWKDDDLAALAGWAEVAVCAAGDSASNRLHPLVTLLALRPQLPTLFLTPADDRDSALPAMNAGASDVLLRVPGYLEQLPTAVRLTHARALRESSALSRVIAMGQLVEGIESDKRRLQELVEQLKAAATTDALTGLANRRGFEHRAGEIFTAATRYDTELTVMLADLDGLKLVNDLLGHAAGDEAIRAAAETIRSVFRRSDFSARIGGDEFVMLLPHTPAANARIVAERLQRGYVAAVEGLQSRIDQQHVAKVGTPALRRLGITIGLTSRTDSPNATPGELLRLADQALYQSKPEAPARLEVATRAVIPAAPLSKRAAA